MPSRPDFRPILVPIAFLLAIFLVLVVTPESRSLPKGEAHDASCAVCAGSEWIHCGRCETSGKLTVTCEKCSGGKKVDCTFQGSIGKEDKFYLQCERGKVACINCLGKGKVVWTVGRPDPCKVCSGGKLSCPYCVGKKKLKCSDCKGKGKITGLCEACFGMTGFPCPLAKRSSPCRGCDGRKKIACTSCLGHKFIRATCKDCYGIGVDLCGDCYAGRNSCRNCSGSGKVRYVSGQSSAGTKKCLECRSRGYSKCTTCKGKGHKVCKPYQEKERCPHCKPTPGRVACPVCQG